MQSLFVSVFVLNILAIQSGHQGLQRYQGPHSYDYISNQGYQYDQSHVNTREDLESIEKDTNNAGGFQSSSPINESGTATFNQKSTTNPSPQPESPMPSQSPPAFMNECICTPFFSCYDDETSSNLTGLVNDRINTPPCQVTQKPCPNANDVCCCNLEPPSSSSSSAQSQTQAPSPSEISTSKASCNCRPTTECFDNQEEIINMKLEMEVCQEPDHVCCHERVLTVTHPMPSLENTTLGLEPLSQSPIPSEISHSTNASECICTPFFKCYDEETSSNLTGLVNDRIHPVSNCPSSEVCCHNLIPPSGNKEDAEDCSGSCIPIIECPSLSVTLEQAQEGNAEAIQRLRSLVCSQSKETGNLNVCCT